MAGQPLVLSAPEFSVLRRKLQGTAGSQRLAAPHPRGPGQGEPPSRTWQADCRWQWLRGWSRRGRAQRGSPELGVGSGGPTGQSIHAWHTEGIACCHVSGATNTGSLMPSGPSLSPASPESRANGREAGHGRPALPGQGSDAPVQLTGGRRGQLGST